MFRRVCITIGDIIGSYHSRLYSRLTGTWYTFMHPRPFQEKPMVRLLPQIYDAYLFQYFGVSRIGSLCIPHLEISFAEILNYDLLFHFDPMVKSSPTIYNIGHFGNPCFTNLRFANTRVFLFGFLGVETPSDSHVVSLMDGPDEFQDFMYRNFHVPVQLQRVFKSCAHFLDPMVTRVCFPSQTYPKAPTLLVWSPLSLWP
jgi:hypothetical protein